MSTFGLKRLQTKSGQVHFHRKWNRIFPASTAPKHCQINGPEHNNAKRVKALLEKCKKLYIMVVVDGVCKKYQADLQLYNNVETLCDILANISDR